MPMLPLEDRVRHTVAPVGFDLFAVFARFEYAMKKGGFRRQNVADAGWRTFAESLPDGFFNRMLAAPEASIYFDAPPRQLIMNDEGGVGWLNNPPVPHDANSLFDSVKRARNNLFHGDKGQRQRDGDLMTAALFILNSAYAEASEIPNFADFVRVFEEGI